MMPWIAPVAILAAGALGGVVNLLMNGGGGIELGGLGGDAEGHTVWRPGPAAIPCVGAVAALVSWALYGSAAGLSIVEGAPNSITWSSVGAAILIGVGGSAWLSAEVDKSILRKTAATAAQSNSDPALAAAITAGTPIQALNAAVAAKKVTDAAGGDDRVQAPPPPI